MRACVAVGLTCLCPLGPFLLLLTEQAGVTLLMNSLTNHPTAPLRCCLSSSPPGLAGKEPPCCPAQKPLARTHASTHAIPVIAFLLRGQPPRQPPLKCLLAPSQEEASDCALFTEPAALVSAPVRAHLGTSGPGALTGEPARHRLTQPRPPRILFCRAQKPRANRAATEL